MVDFQTALDGAQPNTPENANEVAHVESQGNNQAQAATLGARLHLRYVATPLPLLLTVHYLLVPPSRRSCSGSSTSVVTLLLQLLLRLPWLLLLVLLELLLLLQTLFGCTLYFSSSLRVCHKRVEVPESD